MYIAIASRTPPLSRGARVALLALLLAAPAGAANLVTNGHFDTDISGWTLYGTESTIARNLNYDMGTTPSVGSLEIETWISNGGLEGPIQCIPVSTPGTYSASAWVYVPSGQAPTPSQELDLDSYTSPDCTSSPSSQDSSLVGPHPDAWTEHQASLTISGSIQSLRVRLLSGGTTTSTHVFAYYDDVSLLPEPASGSMALSALGTLAALTLARGSRLRALRAGNRVRNPNPRGFWP